MLKFSLLFKEIYKLHGWITQKFLGLRNFQGIVLIGTQRYREIFWSALVYFYAHLGLFSLFKLI